MPEPIKIFINFQPVDSKLKSGFLLKVGNEVNKNINRMTNSEGNWKYKCLLPSVVGYEKILNKTEKTLLEDVPDKIEKIEIQKGWQQLLDLADKIKMSHIKILELHLNKFIKNHSSTDYKTKFNRLEILNKKIKNNSNFSIFYIEEDIQPDIFRLKIDGSFEINPRLEFGKQINNVSDNQVNFRIIIYGHCISAVWATRFAKKLKAKLFDKKNVQIRLISSDPWSGPSAKKEGENIREDLENKNEENRFEKSVLIYTMGGGYFPKDHLLHRFNRAVNFTPQLINNATHIFISEENHNDKNKWEIFYDEVLEQKEDFDAGVYLLSKSEELTFVTTGNLKESIERIYNFSKGREKERISILTNVIARKLNLTPDQLVEYLPNYKIEKDKIISEIKKTLTIKSAFQTVFNMFEPKGLFFGYLDKSGKFYQALISARKLVVGIFKNKSKEAIEILNKEMDKTKRGYKNGICRALVERIEKWYGKV
ncbi:MAG: hypothetical protein LBK29_00670 [Oscillospiraceae bacterium]|jgi:hypothetical protein|nr:hypothetical protein [Oscillospiraceae bacterium]